MATGTVKWFNDAKGSALSSRMKPARTLFVHFSNIAASGFRSLPEGAKVEYEARQERRVPRRSTSPARQQPSRGVRAPRRPRERGRRARRGRGPLAGVDVDLGVRCREAAVDVASASAAGALDGARADAKLAHLGPIDAQRAWVSGAGPSCSIATSTRVRRRPELAETGAPSGPAARSRVPGTAGVPIRTVSSAVEPTGSAPGATSASQHARPESRPQRSSPGRRRCRTARADAGRRSRSEEPPARRRAPSARPGPGASGPARSRVEQLDAAASSTACPSGWRTHQQPVGRAPDHGRLRRRRRPSASTRSAGAHAQLGRGRRGGSGAAGEQCLDRSEL